MTFQVQVLKFSRRNPVLSRRRGTRAKTISFSDHWDHNHSLLSHCAGSEVVWRPLANIVEKSQTYEITRQIKLS